MFVNGQPGSAYNCFTSFYNVELIKCKANCNTYVCKKCKTSIDKAIGLQKQLALLQKRLHYNYFVSAAQSMPLLLLLFDEIVKFPLVE